MKRGFAFIALAAGIALAETAQRTTNVVEGVNTTQVSLEKRRMAKKTKRTLDRFYGYPSDRKSKGQNKRERSQRHSKGWQ